MISKSGTDKSDHDANKNVLISRKLIYVIDDESCDKISTGENISLDCPTVSSCNITGNLNKNSTNLECKDNNLHFTNIISHSRVTLPLHEKCNVEELTGQPKLRLDPYPMEEPLVLLPEEAIFLCYAIGCLIVTDTNGKELCTDVSSSY